MVKGVWGAIIRRTQLFLIFLSKGGNYLREATNRGIVIIQGNMVLLVIPLLNSSGALAREARLRSTMGK